MDVAYLFSCGQLVGLFMGMDDIYCTPGQFLYDGQARKFPLDLIEVCLLVVVLAYKSRSNTPKREAKRSEIASALFASQSREGSPRPGSRTDCHCKLKRHPKLWLSLRLLLKPIVKQ